VERSFFASAPPEPPGPPGAPPRLDEVFPTLPARRPRRELVAPLRRFLVAASRRTTLVLGGAGAPGLRKARAGAAALVAALSISPINRRRAASVLMGAIVGAGLSVAVGLSVGIVGSRDGTPAVAMVSTEAPASAPAVAQAPPVADARARPAFASRRRVYIHRRPGLVSLPTHPTRPTQHPMMTANEDRETYWARAQQSAPAPASRAFFSR